MDDSQSREHEEDLREAASIGDMDLIRKLVEFQNVDVNSQNNMNGRSALHWGAKRNHKTVVEYLLAHGANNKVQDKDGKFAVQLTTNAEIHSLLGGSGDVAEVEKLPITPSYLAHPPFPYSNSKKVQGVDFTSAGDRISQPVTMNNHNSTSLDEELVLKIRVAYSEDPDFIEVELPRVHLCYEALLNLMCAELGVDKQLVARIRKLPNTVIRKDKDVARLRDFQELELLLTNKAMSATSRNYGSIVTNPKLAHEQILY